VCANIFSRFLHRLWRQKTLSIGEQGERAACEYMEAQGYSIVERNWRTKIGEIDAIAEHGEILVIIEVKTSLKRGSVPPELRVNIHKQRKLKQLTALYLKSHRISPPVRFDIVAVWWDKQIRIQHIENAFS
jgi:putative endonuclease